MASLGHNELKPKISHCKFKLWLGACRGAKPLPGPKMTHFSNIFWGIILCMHSANGRQGYNVTSVIGWTRIQNDPCVCTNKPHWIWFHHAFFFHFKHISIIEIFLSKNCLKHYLKWSSWTQRGKQHTFYRTVNTDYALFKMMFYPETHGYKLLCTPLGVHNWEQKSGGWHLG